MKWPYVPSQSLRSEPGVIEQADEEIDAVRAFLEGWVLVGGESFYELPPKQPTISALRSISR